MRPHRISPFKVINVPCFFEKAIDIVDFYSNPPKRVLVLCVDEKTSEDLHLHLFIDNYAIHKHRGDKNWSQRHPKFHIHFIFKSSSWLNLIERWSRNITGKSIRGGPSRSAEKLVFSINDYISKHNKNPETFHWSDKVNKNLNPSETILKNQHPN